MKTAPNPYAAILNPQPPKPPGASTVPDYLLLYVKRPGASRRTTISLTPAQHAEFLGYCFGCKGQLAAEAKLAALDIPADTAKTHFSRDLRELLLQRLRAGYRPAVEAARKLAAENNAAWANT